MNREGNDPPVATNKPCNRPCQKAGKPKDYIIDPEVVHRIAPLRNRPISIQQLYKLLKEIPSEEFTSENITRFLRNQPIDIESLTPYTFFAPGKYTRNLIASNGHFEMMALCWDVGQTNPIHNHEGQSCWVYVLDGELSFTNYKWLGCDRNRRSMHLEELSRVPIAARGSMNVIDEKDAIHRLRNDVSFNQRAMSLHIYAKPLKTCVVYDPENGTCEDKDLSYYSVEGELI